MFVCGPSSINPYWPLNTSFFGWPLVTRFGILRRPGIYGTEGWLIIGLNLLGQGIPGQVNLLPIILVFPNFLAKRV